MNDWQTLQQASYVSLVTYRKSGVEVATPIWAAGAGEYLYAFSEGNAGKIKRLRNNSAAKLAVCDVRGKLIPDQLSQQWCPAQAHVIDAAADIELALEALGRKYGWQMRITNLMSKLTGKYNKRAYLRISQQSSNHSEPPHSGTR